MFKWGFIGSKGIAETVAKELVNNKDIQITAVYSRNFKNCQKFSKKYGAIPYHSFEEFLKEGNFDAVYIGVPNIMHFYYSKICLENKIPVLCEKPLTLSEKSTKELFKLAQNNGAFLAEAMWTWFNKTAYQVKKWVDDGELGIIKEFNCDFSIPLLYFGPKPRLLFPCLGGGSLYDLGIYPVAYAYKLFGMPDEILASAKLRGGIDTKCKITFKYKSGLVCNLTSSFSKLGNCSAKIKGQNGEITVPFMFHSSRKALLKTKNKVLFKDSDKSLLYEREIIEVTNEISNNQIESCFYSSKDSINVMKILDNIRDIIGLDYPNDMETK